MGKRLVELLTDPLDMIRGIRREASRGLRVWGPSLLFPQFIGGIYFGNTQIGLVVLCGVTIMLLTAGYVHRHAPLSRLIGVCQCWWLLTIPWLFHQALLHAEWSIFSVWLWYVVLTITISLIMSAYGFHLYLIDRNSNYRADQSEPV